MPAVRDCYLTQQSDRLEDFNLSLHNVILEFLGINRFLETYAYGAGHAQGIQFYATAIERGEEVAASINPALYSGCNHGRRRKYCLLSFTKSTTGNRFNIVTESHQLA